MSDDSSTTRQKRSRRPPNGPPQPARADEAAVLALRQSEVRATRLQALTAALSAAADPPAVAEAIIAQALPALDALAGNVYLVDDDGQGLTSVAAAGYDAATLERSRILPIDSPTLMADVVRSGEAVMLGNWAERVARYPHHRHLHPPGSSGAVAGIPLTVKGRTIGALSLAFATDRRIDDNERRFIATIAELCAQALERSRLYEKVRQGEAQIRSITDRAPIFLAHCDEHERYVFVNRGYAERYGVPAEEIVGKNISELLGEAAYDAVRHHVAAALAGQEASFEALIPAAGAGLRLMQVFYAPDRDEHGVVRGFVAVSLDITERRKAEQMRDLLAAASANLVSSLDADETLAQVADLAVPAFADMCVTYLRESDAVRAVAISHADPGKSELFREMVRRYPPGFDAPGGLSQVLRSGESIFLSDVPGDYFAKLGRDAGQRELIAAIAPASYIAVPLRFDGRVAGAMEFLLTKPGRRFGVEDFWLAEELARRCGAALESSRLFHSLRASEQRFRQLADTMPQIAWVSSGDGKTLEFVNERWFTYTGQTRPPDAAIDTTAPTHPDDRARERKRWREAVRTGTPYECEVRLRRADGSYRWFLSRGIPVRDAAGNTVRWYGTSTDVDDAKRGEASQRFLAELGQVLAASLDPVQTLRNVVRLAVPVLADYSFVDLSDDGGSLLRVAWEHADPAEQRILDEEISAWIPRRLDENHPIARTLRTGETQFVPVVTADWLERIAFSAEHLEFMRQRRFISQITVPLRARGRTRGAITFFRTVASGRHFQEEDLNLAQDVAERVALALDNARLLEETREAEAKIRRLLDAGVIGVLVATPDLIVEANDTFLTMVGASRDALAGGDIRWPEMTPPEYAEQDARAIAELAERGVCTPFEKEYIRRDGSRIPVLIGAATLEQNPPRWICFVLDLTERKRAEDEWRAFIDATAHDLRNPLTAILGQSQLIQRRLRRHGEGFVADAESRAALIAAAAARSAGLIDDLIDTARMRAKQPLELQLAPVDLVGLVERCAAESYRAAPSHAVRIAAGPFSLVVEVDEARIERVLRNVLDNAVKYSPDGTDIAVRIGHERDDGVEWATVEIADQGIGIPAADQPRIFDQFQRGSNVAGKVAGSGIGLSGARQIVEQHSGTIELTSTEGVGSTFTIRLPLPAGGR